MRQIFRTAIVSIALALSGCASSTTSLVPTVASANPVETKAPVTILVSIDGFRADYLNRGITPNLSALAASGISAAMKPSFPSKTFPNHYTLVTGLRPDRNGIVGNQMTDPRRPGKVFTMATKDPFWWTEAEPLWVTAEKAGIRSATMFWPGSNVDWKGIRPEDWWPFDSAVSNQQRVNAILDWLRRPAAQRPEFLTLYFNEVDHAGHLFGPDAPELNAAIRDVDGAIGQLRKGLAALKQPANLVVVADHGMAQISPDRVVRIDSLLPPDSFTAIAEGPYVGLTPKPKDATVVEQTLLGQHDHYACYRKSNLPARLHYGSNPRVPPIICLAETGWLVLVAPANRKPKGGAHGYDNDAPEMRALFIASGPSIKPIGQIPTFDNVDVAPLVRDLIGLPAGNDLDGNDAPFRNALRR